MRQTAMRAKMQSARPVAPLASPVIGTPPAISYNLARRTPAVPGNLTIGRVDDPSEQAADQVADTVMGQPQPAATTAAVQIRPAAPLPGPIRPTSPAPPELGLGPGRPMPAAVRGFFEPRFGKDLSAVRIHTDAAAGRSADALGARAYSIGSNVVFGGGEYSPDNASGKHLIAHELAHVGQAGSNHVVRRQPDSKSASLTTDQSGALPPRSWLRGVRTGKISLDKEPILQFTDTGEIITGPKLIDWAVRTKRVTKKYFE